MSNLLTTALGVVGLLTLLTACGGPDYTPKPDTELFTAIAALPGVESQSLDSVDSAVQGKGYHGEIVITAGTDPVTTLDKAIAILRQGMEDAGYLGVRVVEPFVSETRSSDVGLIYQADFDKRYGPQPGNGLPPTNKPPLQLTDEARNRPGVSPSPN